MKSIKAVAILLILLAAIPIAAQMQQERVDLDAIYKIKDEGFNRSQVMDTMSWICDVYGARLTNSPNIKAAAEWVKKKLTEYELVNVKLEPWTNPFGRGWSNEKMIAEVTAPTAFPVIAYPKAWTPGTNGTVSGDMILAVIDNQADMDKLKGKLRGKYVMTAAPLAIAARFEPQGHRYTEDELEQISNQPVGGRGGGRGGARGGGAGTLTAVQRLKFYMDEGAVATVEPGRGDDGTVFVQSGTGFGTGPMGIRDPKAPPSIPQIVLAAEHYNRIYRMLERNAPVRFEANVENKFYDNDLTSFNIVGEIPGTDKADEVVMVGAHFDSWHTGTGATDNAAGSAVMIEAMRILKATGLRMRRTVRIGLWTGEEEGLIGSREYVTAHFADRSDMKLKPEHARFAGYFNVDNGTGAIRGVYLQGNEAVAPIFKAWMEPFKNLGMNTLTIRNTGGTDHQSFDAVGLPGFQFIQDAIEYNARTHHSNMDVVDRIQAPDMMKNAVIVASFVYDTANRDQLLPRKPLPKPQPQGQRGGRGGN
jgi:carboxypeptidase Q